MDAARGGAAGENLAPAGEQIVIELPDGSRRQVPRGTTPLEIARQIGRRLERDAVAARWNGQVIDLTRPLEEDGRLEILTFDHAEGREVYRHSTAHLMAQAIKRLWPEAKLAVGPPLEDGFFYDIETPRPLTTDDLEAIEREMARIVAEDLPITRRELSREEAVELFRQRNESYKLEIIESIPEGEPLTAYEQGEFVDLCRGPHLPSTGRIKAFKLTGVAGAYWRGDERGPMLSRVYGTSFPSQQQLREHLERLEEAKRRDHRKLGPELDLFHFEEVAPGYVFWHPKGAVLYRLLEQFSRELQARYGYQEVRTPEIMKVDLWKRSGHWDHYRENMFLIEREDETFGVKPMNCPGHCLIYKTRIRSYRDLPLRLAEYGRLARFERSGTLHGLLRVRGMEQDDAHLFVREDQIEEEIGRVLELVDTIYGTFEMPYEIKLATRPEDFMGEIELWNRAEEALARALDKAGRAYGIEPGDGAFYGPKLDFYVIDSLGRKWQTATVQLDFQLPIRFDLTYVDRDGQEKRPVMIHRAIMGTLERFIGILIEHYAGAFPVWLAPVQVRVLPVSERHLDYGRQVEERLAAAGLRVELDARDEKLGYKIRQAQVEKVPYMLVVGDREAERGEVAVRSRDRGDLGTMALDDFVQQVVEAVRTRRGNPA
ncbi:MAG: threonine--tRNA ligase [Bacillota bacterium]